MDALDDVGLCEAEEVVIPFQGGGVVCKSFPAVVGFLEGMALDHGAHCAVENHDAVTKHLMNVRLHSLDSGMRVVNWPAVWCAGTALSQGGTIDCFVLYQVVGWRRVLRLLRTLRHPMRLSRGLWTGRLTAWA